MGVAKRFRLTPGVALCAIVACALTILLPSFLHGLGAVDWAGWRIVGPGAVLAGWLAVAAWALRKWWVAAVCLLLTLIGPWGYLYPGAVLALVLSGVAALHAIEQRRWVVRGEV